MMREHPLRPSVLVAFVVVVSLCAAPARLAQAQPPAPRQPSLGDPDDSVVRAARELMAGFVTAIPPIYASDPRELKVALPSPNMPAFRIYYGDWVNPAIFVNRLSITYKQAVGGDHCALKTLAAILVHEMAHSTTKDDKVASRAELDMISVFIRQPSTGLGEQMCLMDRQKAIRQYAGLR